MRFHALELRGLEAERIQGFASAKVFSDNGVAQKAEEAFTSARDTYILRVNDAIVRYNERVALLQAEAGACISSLDSPFIPAALYEKSESLFIELTNSITSNAATVEARIEFFMQRQPQFKALLAEVEGLVLDRISNW